jgi:hypothetical protein
VSGTSGIRSKVIITATRRAVGRMFGEMKSRTGSMTWAKLSSATGRAGKGQMSTL